MIEFDIQIPRNVNLSLSTVVSHNKGEHIFKISNFIAKLEEGLGNVEISLREQIVDAYISGHLKRYYCSQAISEGLVCETLSPDSPDWRSGRLNANVKIAFSVDFEFIEDGIQLDTSQEASGQSSVLDDIRQSIEKSI